MWVFFLFFLLAWGGGGFGFGNNAATQGDLTRAELYEGLNNQGLENGIQSQLCQGFNGVNNNITESRFAAQQCCCETNRNIDSLKAQMAEDTCKITTAIHGEAEATRAMITANQMQNLRDRLAESDRALQSANYQISQITQTNNIVNQLRPTPVPAYNVCSPYSQPCYQAGTTIV